MRRGPADIFYSPSLGRYSVGGVEFGEEEFDVALQSPSFLSQPGSPQTPAPDWRRLRGDQYGRYLQSISEGRGLVGNIGVGLRQTGESLVGGVGRGLQMAGLEAPGEALVELGEAIGLSPAEEARSAAIAERQGLMGKIGTATVQSAPTLATAIGAGLAGAAVGGPVGALAGVALSILPMELQSSWEAAEANPDLDVTDSGVQGEILAAALGKTAAQTFGAAWLARGLSPAFRQVLGDVAGKSLGSRITRGVGAGAVEGLAETTAVLVDRVAFDPELRALMTEGDWMAIAPAFAQKYGEEALIAFGAGFLLGAPLGAISSPDAQPDTPPPPQRNVDTDQPVDVLSGTTLEPQAAPGTQGEFFPGMDLGQTPAEPIILAPEQRVGRQLELPFPEAAAPVETQLELPLQAPVGAQGDLFGAASPLPQPASRVAPPPAPPAPPAPPIPQPASRVAPPPAPPLSQPASAEQLARYISARVAPPPAPPAPPAPPIPQAAPAAPPLQLTPQQQVNIQETRAAERQAAVAEQHRQLYIAQTAQIAQARRERDRLRQRNTELAARRGAAADADVEAQAAQASAARRLASAARQETAAAQGAAADARIEEALATQGTPAARILYGNLIRAERRVAAADEAFRAARTSGDPVRIQQAGAELVDAQAALARLRARNEEDVLPEPPVRGEPEAAPAPEPEVEATLKEKAQQWDRANRNRRSEEWFNSGVGESNTAFIAVEGAGATIPAHGMAKVATLSKGVEDLLSMLRGNIRPGLYTDALTNPMRGTGSVTGTPGGTAYRDGPFIITFRRGLSGSPTSADITGVLVNPANAEIIPELRALFPNLAIESYLDVGKLPDLQGTPTPPTPSKGPAPKKGKLAEQAQTKRARQKKAAAEVKKPKGETGAVQEPSPEAGAVRKGSKTSPRVRGKDTKGQEAAGTRKAQAEDAEVVQRQMALSPEQKAALLTELDTDTDGLIDMMVDDPARVDAAIDRILEAEEAQAEEVQVVAPAPRTLAERVDALTDEQLLTVQRRLAATGEPDIDTAIETNPDAVEAAIDLAAPRAAPRRTQEQFEADREREEAAREAAQQRTEIEAAARREAEAEAVPETVIDETADLAPQLWDAIRGSRVDRNDLPTFDDLPETQQDAWIKAVEDGKFASNKSNPPPPEAFAKWREAGLRIAPDEDPARTFTNLVDAAAETQRDTGDLTDVFDNIQDAEMKLAGAKRRKSMSQEEVDAGVDLLIMANDPEMPVEVRDLATQSLAAQVNVNSAQYAELTAIYQRRSELERLNGGKVDPVAQASAELADMIAKHNADPPNSTLNESRFVSLMRTISEGGRENTQAVQLLDYARSTTDLRPNRVRGKIAKIDPRPRGLAAATSLENYNTLEGMVYPDGKTVRPMPIGKLRMAVGTFVRGLKVRPKTHIFANQADLKRKDPALYERAAAARPQGDFDTVAASGYFFGDNDIIIFSDRIANSGHLNTVMAHETMGHFGLRAIIGEAKFNQTMEGLYNRSPREAKELIDRAMAARSISRAEATEEYLSDYAARIEMSTLRRWWAAIKDALNKLGLRFNDDDARYLMAQARRYVKNGDTSSFFDAHVMALQNHAMANGSVPNGTGRFSHANQSTDLFGVLTAVESPDFTRPRTFDDALDGLDGALGVAKRLTGDAADIFDAVKKSVFSPTVWRGIRNEGFQEGIRLLKKRYDIARREIANAERIRSRALNPQIKIGGLKFGAGLDAQGRERAGFAMKINRIGHSFRYRPKRNPPSIFVYNPTTDTYQLQSDTLTKLKQSGRYTREQFAEGVTIRYETTENMTEAERTRLRAERDAELAKIPEDNKPARKRVERKYETLIKDNSYTVVRTRKVKHTFTDKEWEAFNQELDSIAAITVRWLKSHLTRYNQETTSTYRKIASVMSAPMTSGDRKMIDRFVQRFNEIMVENVEFDQNGQRIASSIDVRRAEEFALKMNAALLGTGTDRINALFTPDKDGRTLIPVSERAEITAAIKDFKTRYSPPEATPGRPRGPESFVVQAEVRSLANQLMLRQDAETRAVQTLETGYVPFARKGKVQVRVAAIGANGREYTISDRYRKTLPYFLAETNSEADGIKDMVNELLRPNPSATHTLEVFDPDANNGLGGNVLMEVQLVAKREAALTAPAADPELNLNESLRFLRRFNVNLDPVRSEQIIRAFVTQNDSMLTRQFKAEFTPGSENDLTSVISQHIESRASTIARNETSVELGNLLDRSQESSRLKWSGDPVEYNRLKAEMERVQADPAATEDAKDLARRRFDEYHSWFKTNDSQGNANKYYSEFRQAVDFLDQQKGVLETDLASSKTVSAIQMWTSVSFLMASIASGGLNLVGVPTNVLPALVSYNPKNGFGGGFGEKGATELFRSIKIAGMGGKFDTSEYWSGLSNEELQQKGITRAAADFMAKGIDGGFLQAAQTNALMGTSRGRMRSGLMNKGIMALMTPFNWTEQASRRASALAAFNLEYDRQIAAGVDPQEAAETAERFAENLVDFTLGNYTTLGRPALFRGGPQQFLFMFKMFVVNSAALLGNLSWSGKAIMLGSLLLLSGLRGVPFAEDMEDIVDTLAQKLGIPMGSVRAEMIKLGDQIYPGLGKILVSGAISEILGGTDFGARTSNGNILPGSSVFLAGSDTLRELEEIGGPMVSFAKYGALTIGNALDFLPGGAPGDVETLLREQPISILRAIGDTIAYQRSGAIVDKRGYVISDEFDASTALWRIAGFYPKAASDRYSLIRMDIRAVEYQKALKLAFRDKIVKAQSRGDMETVRALYRDVNDWNRRARGTGLEIRGMRDSVQRALRSQRMTATERFSAAQARDARRFLMSAGEP